MFDIVMPLFNKGAFVAETIRSVLNQRYQEWTLFVVDDGSTDDGAAVVRSFTDPRIRLLEQANAGPGAARNSGIRVGSAEWIAFIDADDLWLEDHLEELGELREHFPSAGLIGTAFDYWEGQAARRTRGSKTHRTAIRYFREIADGRVPFYTSSAAFSRRAIEHVGYLKPVVVGDETELWARLALHAPVAVSSKRTVLYRVETGGITDSHSPSVAADEMLRLEDVSLPVATLLRHLPDVGNPSLRREIFDYIDHEVGVALIQAVRFGQVARARQLLRLFHGQPRGRARVAMELARLPYPVGTQLLRLVLRAKRVFRSLRNRTPLLLPKRQVS